MRSRALRLASSLLPAPSLAASHGPALFAGWSHSVAQGAQALTRAAAGGSWRALSASAGAAKPQAKETDKEKRPLTAYFRFAVEQRLKVVSEIPDISFLDVGKELGKRWKALSVNDKRHYFEAYEAEMALYDQRKKKST